MFSNKCHSFMEHTLRVPPMCRELLFPSELLDKQRWGSESAGDHPQGHKPFLSGFS